MYYVYLLKSLKYQNKIYIGVTSDLKKRMHEHNAGLTYTTQRILPVELIYYEAYKSKTDAQKREHMLKQYGNSLARLKKRLSSSLSFQK